MFQREPTPYYNSPRFLCSGYTAGAIQDTNPRSCRTPSALLRATRSVGGQVGTKRLHPGIDPAFKVVDLGVPPGHEQIEARRGGEKAPRLPQRARLCLLRGELWPSRPSAWS